jgi:hypothetical protein
LVGYGWWTGWGWRGPLFSNGFQDSGTFVCCDLLITMEVDYKSRYVLYNAANRGNIPLAIFQSNANFRTSDVETP